MTIRAGREEQRSPAGVTLGEAGTNLQEGTAVAFTELMNDRVALVKIDGRRFDSLPASVQSGMEDSPH